jgi:hypothetical protein
MVARARARFETERFDFWEIETRRLNWEKAGPLFYMDM